IKDMPEKLPVILSGDFNVDQFNESYKLLNTSGILQDSFDKAEFVYNSNGTFNNFKVDNWTNRRIDHIFLTNDFKVKKYGILTDTYQSKTKKNDGEETYQARTPSDHYPVMIIAEIRTDK
ncbi:MAG: endonuclease/exonuclease/phosphatase family protein, partial [Phocaeicola sp.]